MGSSLPLEIGKTRRPRFRLRTLFGFMLVSGIFFAIAHTAGVFVAAGSVTCLCAIAWAAVWRSHGAWLLVRGGVVVLSLVALWFLAVEFSVFIADCPDCYHGSDIFQYRVFGVPVSTHVRQYPTVIELTLKDVGAPCEHHNTEPWHQYRFWGLVYPAWPRINGTVRLYDGVDEYTNDVALRFQRLGENDPQRARQLHDRVIHDHDYKGFWQVFDKIKGEVASDRE